MRPCPPIVVSVAGSDPSGGAGLQADLRAIAAHGLYGTAVPTAITVQDTAGVRATHALPGPLVAAQLRALLADLAVAAIKIGMLGDAGVTRAVLDVLAATDPLPPVVLDPVLRASSGAPLLDPEGLAELRARCGPLVALITPNWAEAAALLGREADGAELAAALAAALGCPVLVTGGDTPQGDRCVDHLSLPSGTARAWSAPRLPTPDDHGTGCLLSTSIACALARGLPLEAAVEHGRTCVQQGLRDAVRPGGGRGAVWLSEAPGG